MQHKVFNLFHSFSSLSLSLPLSLSPLDYSRAIKRLPTIKADHGIHLSALVDIEETDTSPARKAGDEWQLRGPLTYIPKPEEVRINSNICSYIYILYVPP